MIEANWPMFVLKVHQLYMNQRAQKWGFRVDQRACGKNFQKKILGRLLEIGRVDMGQNR